MFVPTPWAQPNYEPANVHKQALTLHKPVNIYRSQISQFYLCVCSKYIANFDMITGEN